MDKFRVWCPADGEIEERDAREFEAFDAQSAAEMWAEDDDCDSADYRIVGGTDVVVAVREVATGVLTRWSVTGESVPSYRALEVEES